MAPQKVRSRTRRAVLDSIRIRSRNVGVKISELPNYSPDDLIKQIKNQCKKKGFAFSQHAVMWRVDTILPFESCLDAIQYTQVSNWTVIGKHKYTRCPEFCDMVLVSQIKRLIKRWRQAKLIRSSRISRIPAPNIEVLALKSLNLPDNRDNRAAIREAMRLSGYPHTNLGEYRHYNNVMLALPDGLLNENLKTRKLKCEED